ncbi:hypothetical protein M758_2G063300 [Ceratodon purpureus]|nr:hypothetical protein M758_2G063300 [Ceratodon purpureus]
MGGGTLWRSVARAVGAAAPTVAVTASTVHCAACSAGPTVPPRARAAPCSCKATGAGVGAQAHPGLTAVSYGPRQFWDLEDWEIAGDEERDHYVFGSLPTVKEVEEASSDLQNALRLGFFTPPVPKTETLPKAESSSAGSPGSPRGPTIVEVTEVSTVTTVGDLEDDVTSDLSAPSLAEAWIEPPPYEVATSPRDGAPTLPEVEAWIEPPSYEVATSPKAPEAPSSAMLEAFHQFQHNPQVQGMVVSLATDKGVWDAVLANEKIKEFRRNFSAPTSEDSFGGAMDQKVKGSRKNTNVFSRFFWKSKKAFADFISNFQDFVTALFETAEKKRPGSDDNEKTNFFERSVKACMMLAVLVLAIVVFKRSAAVKRG